jgi:hypothetical protein
VAEDELYGEARGDELPPELATAQGRKKSAPVGPITRGGPVRFAGGAGGATTIHTACCELGALRTVEPGTGPRRALRASRSTPLA